MFTYLSCLKCKQQLRKGRWRTHQKLCYQQNKINLVDATLLAIVFHPKLRDKFPDEDLAHDIRKILNNFKKEHKKCMKYANAAENLKGQRV